MQLDCEKSQLISEVIFRVQFNEKDFEREKVGEWMKYSQKVHKQ